MGCMARSPGRGPVHGLDHKRAAMLTCVWHDVYLSYRTSGGLTFANRPATISSFTVSGNDQGAMPAAGYALAPCLGLHPRFISAGACAVLCLTSRTMFFVLSACRQTVSWTVTDTTNLAIINAAISTLSSGTVCVRLQI